MAVNFSDESQNVHSVVAVLPDVEATNPQDEPTSSVYFVGAPDLKKNEMFVNSETNLMYQTKLMMDKLDDFAPCNLDVDIEKGKAEIPKSSEECVAYLKSDDSLARALQKVIWLTGKFMQLFMNQNPDSPKFASKDRVVPERVYDTISNRSRKYKRSQSFNSRRVVLLFSVMSSLGTIILILLTLKVKQISDGSGNL
ncbi:hypothetical protein ACS0TY_029368 [Phlomoides rotata]